MLQVKRKLSQIESKCQAQFNYKSSAFVCTYIAKIYTPKA